MSRSGNFNQRTFAGQLALRVLLAGAAVATLLVQSAAAQFFETESLRASRVDFYNPHAYVNQLSGFETIYSRQNGVYSVKANLSVGPPLLGFRDVLNNEPTDVTGAFFATDFSDLHEFNIAFDSAGSSRVERTQAFEVVYVTWLSDQSKAVEEAENRRDASLVSRKLQDPRNRDSLGTEILEAAPPESEIHATDVDQPLPDESLLVQPEGWALVVGIRAIQTEDSQGILAEGGILGRSSFDTRAANDVAGPQAGLVWRRSRGPWSVRLQGTALAGYNLGNIRQNIAVGEGFVPGAINRPIYAQPSYFSNYQAASRFSPSGELLAETKWELTDAVTMRLSWAGVVVENVLFTDDRTIYQLPDFGLGDPGNQRLFVQTFFCGLEYVR